MNDKNLDPTKTSTKLTLAELLARSMEQDELVLAQQPTKGEDRERWDEDEGSFGG